MIGMGDEAYGGIGLAVYNYEWMAAMVLVVFVLFFLPFYKNDRNQAVALIAITVVVGGMFW